MPIPESRGIVAGIVDSASARPCLEWAAELAARTGAPLRLVGAFEAPRPRGWSPRPPSYPVEAVARARSATERTLAECRGWCRQWVPQAVVETAACEGSAVDVLLDQSTRAGLLVIGSHPVAGHLTYFIGSVGHSAAMRSSCPVLLARGPAPSAVDRIVVGVDLDAQTDTVLNYAFRLAARMNLPIDAVYCWVPPVGPVLEQLTGYEDEDLPRVEAALADRLAPWRSEFAGVAVQAVVRNGWPIPELLDQAGRNPLIIGRHRRHVVPALGASHLGALYHPGGALIIVPD